MAESEEEKQNYLTENILEKGYEAEEFADFLSIKKGQDGLDLDNWTMDELKNLVSEFIEYHKEIEKEKENINQPQPIQNIPTGIYNPLENPLSNSNFNQNNYSYNYNITSDMNLNQNMNNMNLNQNMNISPNMNLSTNINNNQNINIYQNMNLNENMNFNQNMNLNQNMNINPNMNINQNINFNSNMNIDPNMINNQNMNNNITLNKNINMINNNMNIDQNKSQNDINNSIQNSLSQNNNNIQFQQSNSMNETTDVYGITNEAFIPCGISEKSELSRVKDIKIEVSVGEKISGKMFSKAYMKYAIFTSPLNLKVFRRYTDFEWLRQTLLHLYSSNIIPPIPKKTKMGKNKFDESYLLKRTRTLERFLNILMEDPILKESQIIFDFLSLEEGIKFEETKKLYQKIKIPQNLTEYKNPEGKLKIIVNEDNEVFYKSIKDNTEANIDLLTKLNKNLKLLNNEISAVTNRMEEISKNCFDLFLNSAKFCDDNDIKRSYYQVKDMFKFCSNTLKDQLTVFNINLREYFKYTRNTFKSMKVLLNNVDNYRANYFKAKKNLISKKEELIKKPDVGKWDLGPNKNMVNLSDLFNNKSLAFPVMLYNETTNVNNLKKKYGYFLNRVIEEYERLRYLISSGHKQNIVETAKMLGNIISDLLTKISEIGDGHQKYDINNIAKEINKEFIEKQNEKQNDKGKGQQKDKK